MSKQGSKPPISPEPTPRAEPSLDVLLNWTDKHVFQIKTRIQPAPESKPRTPFATKLPKEKISTRNLTSWQMLQVIPKALPLMANIVLGSRMYNQEFKPLRTHAEPLFIAQLEAIARAAGAKDMAYIKVPRNAIFQDKGIPCEYAIVFTVKMDKKPISTAPSFECQLEVMDGYKKMSIISNKLAKHLRKNGFAAYPGTALGGLTDYVHLAELAGLGVIGYHGLLITPSEGARVRLNTIYTNITNLPTLQARGQENKHLWVRDFCAMCNKCIRKCPVGAIYDQPQARGDGGFQSIDHATCRDYFTEHHGCAVCLAVCPFSQMGYEKVKAGFKGNDHATQIRIGTANQLEQAF